MHSFLLEIYMSYLLLNLSKNPCMNSHLDRKFNSFIFLNYFFYLVKCYLALLLVGMILFSLFIKLLLINLLCNFLFILNHEFSIIIILVYILI